MRKSGDVDGLLRELGNPRQTQGDVRGIKVTHTVRGRAAHELSTLRAPRAAKLIACLLDDPESTVRADAAIALGRLQDDTVGGLLIDALRDNDESVMACAVRSLGQLKFRPAAIPLTRLLDHPNVRVRIMTAKALSRIGDKSAVNSLKGAMRKLGWRHPIARAKLARAILTLGLKR